MPDVNNHGVLTVRELTLNMETGGYYRRNASLHNLQPKPRREEINHTLRLKPCPLCNIRGRMLVLFADETPKQITYARCPNCAHCERI